MKRKKEQTFKPARRQERRLSNALVMLIQYNVINL